MLVDAIRPAAEGVDGLFLQFSSGVDAFSSSPAGDRLIRTWLVIAGIVLTLFSRVPSSEAQVKTKDDGGVAHRAGVEVGEDIKDIVCEGVIERRLDQNSNHIYFVDIKSPVLEGARKYRLKLKIVNPFDESIKFSKVSVSCGCAKFESNVHEIPALGSSAFEMHLDVPNQISMSLGRVNVSFFDESEPAFPILRIAVTYPLHGVFGFRQDREIVELPKSEAVAVAKLPVVLIEPMTLDKLELFYSDNLRDFGVQIVSDDPDSEIPYIKIDVARQALPRQGMSGEVGLRRKGTNHVSGVLISFKHQDVFTLRPESLRLSRDNNSKAYEATAMLRVSVPTSTNQDEGATEEQDQKKEDVRNAVSPPEVGLLIDGQPAKVRVQAMGRSGIYRLTIQHDGPFVVESGETLEVCWKLVWNGEERVIESHAFLPDR